MGFGKYLKEIREKRKLSIRQISLKSGVSGAYLSQVENGKRGTPTPDILRKIAPVLKVPYEELLIAAGYIEEQDEDKQKEIDLIEAIFNKNATFDGEPLQLTEPERQIIVEFIRSVVKLMKQKNVSEEKEYSSNDEHKTKIKKYS